MLLVTIVTFISLRSRVIEPPLHLVFTTITLQCVDFVRIAIVNMSSTNVSIDEEGEIGSSTSSTITTQVTAAIATPKLNGHHPCTKDASQMTDMMSSTDNGVPSELQELCLRLKTQSVYDIQVRYADLENVMTPADYAAAIVSCFESFDNDSIRDLSSKTGLIDCCISYDIAHIIVKTYVEIPDIRKVCASLADLVFAYVKDGARASTSAEISLVQCVQRLFTDQQWIHNVQNIVNSRNASTADAPLCRRDELSHVQAPHEGRTNVGLHHWLLDSCGMTAAKLSSCKYDKQSHKIDTTFMTTSGREDATFAALKDFMAHTASKGYNRVECLQYEDGQLTFKTSQY